MNFIDLFAGLGGFNLALTSLGHECVFASEIDEGLRGIYYSNFGLMPAGDIRSVNSQDIPKHDILCAGFPCQPFSKAGRQQGFKYPELGELYAEILRILEYHQPNYIILENVPNLRSHANGQSWSLIEKYLSDVGYEVSTKKLSPHDFGIPQIRHRMYIVGSLGDSKEFKWPEIKGSFDEMSILDILDSNPSGARQLTVNSKNCLTVWQSFLDQMPSDEAIPRPLWSMEFGATYPFVDTTPSQMLLEELRNYRGSYGKLLKRCISKDEALQRIPSYARRQELKFPDWKINIIRKNREFYKRHKKWLNKWKKDIQDFPFSYQKLEWNCRGESDRDLKSYIIQFRPSGVRVKRPSTAPSLVAMTTTQIPIIGWEERYITPDECKRLQSMNGLDILPEPQWKAYQALGNAVNVEVVRQVAQELVE